VSETLNQLWARAIIEELVRGGVQHAVVCPGSRSTPLALACADHRDLKTWSIIDERSAAFFALGVAKATGRPAAVVATSGTAGANFYPAVIEAELSRTPMVVLTADRPPELQGWGAPQTIDQQGLFGAHVRCFADVGIPEATDAVVVHLRAQTARAVAAATGGARGAVHLNVPFREPLAPQPDATTLIGLSEAALIGRGTAPFTQIVEPERAPNAVALQQVAERLRRAEKGVIICGPRDQADGFADAVHALGKALGYPVFAEAASNARFGHPSEASGAYDSVLRSQRFAKAHVPEIVLRFGGGLTPKAPQQWLDQSGAFTVQFTDRGQLVDPQHSASLVIEGDPVAACAALMKAVPARGVSEWRKVFAGAETRARRALSEAMASDGRLTEPRIAREVASALPSHATLFVSSSMPIRDLDAFAVEAEAPVRVLSNRGANGIDGVTSAALGAAAALQKPTVLLTGDVAFLHDLGALVGAARNDLSLCVVVVNNNGGGIFDFLPVASRTEHFERLFSTAHSVSFEAAAASLGARYRAPADASALREAVRAGV
jgi:2-succinyl-5-enolpyruvyl-6-hydroxy-3-cyclohexene-1-carboxylate synthase